MRRILLAAVAAAAIASPAAARDNTWYAGVEGGLLFVEDMTLDYDDGTTAVNNLFEVDHNMGFDVDVIGGYDFGWIRAEAETAYKRASIDDASVDPSFLDDDLEEPVNADGRATALSAMLNLLLDMGDESMGAYAGAGIGLARVKYNIEEDTLDVGFRDTDDAMAVQGIAGIRAAISPNLDLGLKYRYFRTRKLDFEGDVGFDSGPFDLEGRWRSHSLLASLIYNFAPPPPPPPPPAGERG